MTQASVSDKVFAALADPTRRHVLQLVSEYGPTSATILERELPVSRQAVVKHLVVLSKAGLVASRRHGQEVRYSVVAEPLDEAAAWIAGVGARWDARLARLRAFLTEPTSFDASYTIPYATRRMSAYFGHPDMSSIAAVSADERDDLDTFFQTRVEADVRRGRWRGHFYQLTADLVMLEHRPDYARAFYDAIPAFRNRLRDTGEEDSDAVELIAESLQHLPMYILYGWETGIYNEFRHLRFRGLSKAQLMELVMFAQLQAGMRGLQLVYNSVSRLLVDLPDPEATAVFPRGWAPDPEAFKCGLDLTTRAFTHQDRDSVVQWYDRTIGYVPKSVAFAMSYHPEFYKWHRARWEVIFQTLPKQTAPYVMLRQHMLTGNAEALREAVLLGKAWGVTREWITHGLMVSAFYTGFEALHVVEAAVGDIFEAWA